MNRFLLDIRDDLRVAARQLRKAPGFTLTAILTLALGIGANTAIFTLVQGILLRSLPVADPSRLYRIGDTHDCCVEGGFPDNHDFSIFSYGLYLHLKQSAPEFEQLAAMQAGQNELSVRYNGGVARPMRTELVTGNYFSTLGVNALLGRVFAESDDTPSASPTVVLSYATWESEFASDPAIVGSVISVQTHPFTVIGVAPRGFFGDRVTNVPPAFWLPLNAEPLIAGPGSILHHDTSNFLYLLGRVRAGVSIPTLQDKLSTALRAFLGTVPTYAKLGGAAEIAKQHVTVVKGGGGIQNLQQETGDGLTMLMILSTVVLLIACANIANLLLARGTSRRVEVSIRMALGAGRRRLVRQIITESLLLSCLGGVAGLFVAYAGSRLILTLAFPGAKHLPIEASPSLPVLGFAFAIAVVTGVLFSLAPAWMSTHAEPAEALRGVGRSTRDRSSLPQKTLVVLQAALSLVLLTGAVLMTRSLTNLEHQNFGISTANRYVVNVDPSGAGYTAERLPALYRQIESRFAELPGVADVGLAMYSPLAQNNWGECVIPQGHGEPHAGDRCGSTWDRFSPQMLDALNVPILRGRGFTAQDTQTSLPVAIVNQAFAKRFFPGQDPVGKHFGIDFAKYSSSWEIVGVFEDFKMNNPREEVRPVFLRPTSQFYNGFTEDEMRSGESNSMFISAIVLAFSRPQDDVESLVRRTITSIDPNLTVSDLHSLDSQVANNFNQERLIARLMTVFGVLALILASVGLYGTTAYLVARRTNEIGIRMALGATRGRVINMVLRGVLVQIAAGLLLGVPAALLAGHLMASQLYGVGAYDSLALALACAVLAVCAIAAGFLPARRAASVEPMQALRID